MNPIKLLSVGGHGPLTRDQVVTLARMAEVTADELASPLPLVVRETRTERHIERVDGNVVRVLKTQDKKYGVVVHIEGNFAAAQLANLETGMEIPLDEPIMIFRAKDVHALAAIETYCRVVTADGTTVEPQTANSAQERFMEFQQFAIDHADRMRVPT